MSSENDNKSTIFSEENLTFLLAIPGRLDAQSRIIAENLDKNRYIYHTYAVIDSLNSSYSMYKYYFDLFLATGDSNRMHDVMLTPGAIVGITAETLFFVSFSLFASIYDGEKNDKIKQFIVAAWPYVRDITKGLKNAYKGWRSTIQAIQLIHGADLKFLIMPVGIALSIIGAANRVLLRSLVESRKAMMKINVKQLLEIKKLNYLILDDSTQYIKGIKSQTLLSRIATYGCVSTGGLIDGLYLYIGVLTVTPLIPPLFIFLGILSCFYTATCLVTRLYEEYDFQVRLMVTETKCRLAIVTKLMETAYLHLLLAKQHNLLTVIDKSDLDGLKEELSKFIDEFTALSEQLKSLTNRSYLSAGLIGIRNGLYGYSAVASFIFLLATFFSLSGIAFPPALLIFTAVLGIVLIAGLFAQALWINHKDLIKSQEKDLQPFTLLKDIKAEISQPKIDFDLPIMDKFSTQVIDSLDIHQPQVYFFQEWFEVFRSFFSGLGKGQKFIDFSCNGLQEQDEEGYYHDTNFMLVLGAVNAILFSIVLALRALSRGLGRPPLGQVDLAKGFDKVTMNLEEKEDDAKAAPSESTTFMPKKRNGASNKIASLLRHSFYNKENKGIPPSKSSYNLNEMDKTSTLTPSNTIVGLV